MKKPLLAELSRLTEAQREEVDRRLAEHTADPESAVAWDDVRTKLWSRLGQERV